MALALNLVHVASLNVHLHCEYVSKGLLNFLGFALGGMINIMLFICLCQFLLSKEYYYIVY